MLARPLQLGPVALTTNLMLAPIARWCELAWRVTCRELGGVGLACTDLLNPRGLICDSGTSRDLARTCDLDQPIGMQLYGCDPDLLAEGVRWCVDHGATVVDLNMGCPVDKVCKTNGGSMLMTDPDLAQRIAQAVRQALPDSVPLTCKMRLGWTQRDADRNAAGELACRLIGVGVAGITIHGRTTEQRFKGSCDLAGIRRVVETVAATSPSVPVVGNGDIKTPHDVVAMMQQTGCAGVMIGRGAFAMPWIFRLAWGLQERTAGRESGVGRSEDGGAIDLSDLEPSEPDKARVIADYFERMRQFRGDAHAMHVIRQKISWLARNLHGPHTKALKETIRTAPAPEQVHEALTRWVESTPIESQHASTPCH